MLPISGRPARKGSGGGGSDFRNAEVEPFAAIQRANPNRLVAAWQQDRWSNGPTLRAHSTDGGNQTNRVAVIRSAHRGLTWMAPVFIAEKRTVGTRDAVTGQAIRDGRLIPSDDGSAWAARSSAARLQGPADQARLNHSKRARLPPPQRARRAGTLSCRRLAAATIHRC